jgi:hypothetical protein
MDSTQTEVDKAMLPEWSDGFQYKGESHNILMARAFRTTKAPSDPKQPPVTETRVYLLAQAPNGFFYLGYVNGEDLQAGKPRHLQIHGETQVSSRFAVSDHLVFFMPSELGVIVYYRHSDFVDAATSLDKKPHGTLKLSANGVSLNGAEKVFDLFACSDDHLLLVAGSEMWSVTRTLDGKAGDRNFAEDKWEWSKMQGAAQRIVMTKSHAVDMFESLRETVMNPAAAAA